MGIVFISRLGQLFNLRMECEKKCFTSARKYGMLFYKRYIWLLRETCLFPGVDREEAPAAESAPTYKRMIPLASLYRVSNVHGSTSLTVGRARFPAHVSNALSC